jgi:hypothetical protein
MEVSEKHISIEDKVRTSIAQLIFSSRIHRQAERSVAILVLERRTSMEMLAAHEHTQYPCRLAVLGSTGSIGQQTLDVVRTFPDQFQVVVLAAHTNVIQLAQPTKCATRLLKSLS